MLTRLRAQGGNLVGWNQETLEHPCRLRKHISVVFHGASHDARPPPGFLNAATDQGTYGSVREGSFKKRHLSFLCTGQARLATLLQYTVIVYLRYVT